MKPCMPNYACTSMFRSVLLKGAAEIVNLDGLQQILHFVGCISCSSSWPPYLVQCKTLQQWYVGGMWSQVSPHDLGWLTAPAQLTSPLHTAPRAALHYTPLYPTVSIVPLSTHCINCNQLYLLYPLRPSVTIVPHFIRCSLPYLTTLWAHPGLQGTLGIQDCGATKRSQAVSSLLSHRHPVLGPKINLYNIGICSLFCFLKR